MGDFGVKRNASGYYDETAYKGMTKKNPGEVWKTYDGKEVLIIKPHNGVCTTLTIVDDDIHGEIELPGCVGKYTEPAMLGYTFNNKISAYSWKMDEADFEYIIKEINATLGIEIKVKKTVVEQTKAVEADGHCENGKRAEQIEELAIENSKLKGQLQAYRDFLYMLMGKES